MSLVAVVLSIALGLAILSVVFFFTLSLCAVVEEENLDQPKAITEVYVKWDENSNFIMAFVAEHFKTSNTLLMDLLSIHMRRSTSSLKRKISRLRGIKTNKSPYASDVEREFVTSLDGAKVDDKGYAKLLMTALINIGLSDEEIMDLQDLMSESELNK